MFRELRARRQACQRCQSALEAVALTVLLMSSIAAVPVLVAVLGTFIH